METLFDALSAFNREHGIEEPLPYLRPEVENAHPNVTPRGDDDDISEKKEKKRKHKKDKKKKKSKKQKRAPTPSEEEESEPEIDADSEINQLANQFRITPGGLEEI